MSMTPRETELVELHRNDTGAFVLRVGHHIVHLDTQAIAVLIGLLTEYPNGTMGQAVLRGLDELPSGHPGTPVILAHIGAYDAANRSLPASQRQANTAPASDAHAPAADDYQWSANHLHLAVTVAATTYVAKLSRRTALSLVHAATRGMSDAT